MNRVAKIRHFIASTLAGDGHDPRSFTVKDSLLGMALGVFMVLVVAFHLVLLVVRIVISLLLFGYDMIVRVLGKISLPEDNIGPEGGD